MVYKQIYPGRMCDNMAIRFPYEIVTRRPWEASSFNKAKSYGEYAIVPKSMYFLNLF
jgi:hypothetical protein